VFVGTGVAVEVGVIDVEVEEAEEEVDDDDDDDVDGDAGVEVCAFTDARPSPVLGVEVEDDDLSVVNVDVVGITTPPTS